jgi:ribosomal-protein-alanine N-acetyltransferase
MQLVTSRFLLRDFVEADRPAFLAYHADPRYLVFSGPEVGTPEHAHRLFDTFQAWAFERPRLRYQLAIVRRQDPHRLVGCGGLRGAKGKSGEAELGIELAPNYWGRHGYAVEVGGCLLQFGFCRLGLGAIHAVTMSGNVRAARLAEWFGAETVGVRPGPAWMSARGWNEVEWRITRERWKPRVSGEGS